MSTMNRPWLSSYDEGVKSQLCYPEVCIHDLLQKKALDNGSLTAIEIGSESITYGELEALSTNLAGNLVALGVKKGDVVGICMANSIPFVIAYFGILKAGGVVAAMNPAFPQRELQFQVDMTAMRLVFTTHDKTEVFLNLNPDQIMSLVIVGEAGVTENNEACFSFDKFIKSSKEIVALPLIAPSDPAVVQFSGGTTGTPKAAVGAHRNIVANVIQFREWLVNLEDGKETFLVAIPLYHVYGLVLGLMLGIATGARMIFVEHAGNVDEIINAFKRYPISYFPAVPSIFGKINDHPDVIAKRISLATIKACISGSAPLLDSIRLAFENNTGGYLVEGYGLSEAPTATHCNPILGEKRSGSIGLPLPDVECKIMSMTNPAAELGTDEEGELWIKGPQVMLGYLRRESENSVVLVDGWLKTGDIARMDADGYFYLSGRIKELVKVHGMQVWPTEVEEVISSHPAVRECVAAGIPDRSSGERIKLWVVPQQDQSISLQEIREFCREKLAAYKIPVQLEIRNSIPRTPVGKILRRALVQEHLEMEKKKRE